MFAHANQGVVSGAVVLLLAACGGVSGMGQKSGSPPDTSNIEIHGDTSADVNKLAVEAIADLQDYWGKEFPHLYSKDYVPVKGGFFAVILSSGDLPPCASDASEISRNAFYRPDASTYHIRRATSVKGSRRCLFSAARATSSARARAGRASRLSARASSTGRSPAWTTRTVRSGRARHRRRRALTDPRRDGPAHVGRAGHGDGAVEQRV
jgi:hypothetical protein